MPLRCLRRRLSIPGRPRNLLTQEYLSVVKNSDEEEEEERVCRFCWQTEDEDRGGELLNPCLCSGSVKYVHRRCLGAWQRTQRSQGALRKSFRCDICKERYRVRRAEFSGAKLPFGRLPTGEECKDLIYSVLGSPVWQVAFDIWKILILANGSYFAACFGLRGLKAGCVQGWKHIVWYLASMKNCGAQIAVLSSVLKFLQLPAVLLTVGGGVLTILQFLVHAIIGFYCAAIFGFAQGSSQVLKATFTIAWSFLNSGTGVAIRAVGRTINRSVGIVRGLLPYIQHWLTAAIMSQFR